MYCSSLLMRISSFSVSSSVRTLRLFTEYPALCPWVELYTRYRSIVSKESSPSNWNVTTNSVSNVLHNLLPLFHSTMLLYFSLNDDIAIVLPNVMLQISNVIFKVSFNTIFVVQQNSTFAFTLHGNAHTHTSQLMGINNSTTVSMVETPRDMEVNLSNNYFC